MSHDDGTGVSCFCGDGLGPRVAGEVFFPRVADYASQYQGGWGKLEAWVLFF
jgi:hypothetical protein